MSWGRQAVPGLPLPCGQDGRSRALAVGRTALQPWLRGRGVFLSPCPLPCRCCYWASLRISSAYRGFGFGLSFFPALAMTAYNLFCLYQLGFGFLFAPAGGVGSWTTPAPPPTLAPTSPGN